MDLSFPHLINTIPPPSSSPKGSHQLSWLLQNTVKVISTRQCAASSTVIHPRHNWIDPIWLLGVWHPGYEPPLGLIDASRSSSINSRWSPSFRTSASSTVIASLVSGNNVLLPLPLSSKTQGAHWLPEFLADFTSLVLITYHSHFYPIQDLSLTILRHEKAEAAAASVPMPI